VGPFSKGSQFKMQKFKKVIPFLLLTLSMGVLTGCGSTAENSTAPQDETQAASDTGYRYWGYYQAKPGENNWTTAMTGPTVDIADGSVEGWAFTFAGEVINTGAPKAAPDFENICGSTSPVAGSKRIALVVEFGPDAIAPEGEIAPKAFDKCVVLPKQATGFDLLTKATEIRSNASGMVCSIAAFPKKECSEEAIKTPAGLK
jgi:hypothetical protein